MIYKDIGKKIQKAREDSGLSQEELAARLGVSQAALSNYELGKRRLYLANIQHIADVLKKPLNYFLDGPPGRADTREQQSPDPIIDKIIQLVKDLPQDERDHIIEYIQWRKDRLK